MWDHDVEILSKVPFPWVLIDLCKKMIELGHLVAWSYFKRLQELYLSPFCGITAKEIARFENWSTVWPKLPKKMRLPNLCQKSQEIANLCLLIHFVAKFCRHPKIWETRVVPGLPHPWLVLLRSWGLEEKLEKLKIKTWRSRLEDQDLKISPRRISGWPTWSARLSCQNRWWRIL